MSQICYFPKIRKRKKKDLREKTITLPLSHCLYGLPKKEVEKKT
jgi:hypothetical protein